MRKLALHWQILIAIGLAAVAGYFVNSATTEDFIPGLFGVPFVAMFDYIGEIFLNALKMIIVPLILSSIIIGVANIGSGGNLGALGGKTLLFYVTTTFVAIMIGLFVINVVNPGVQDGEPVRELLALEGSTEDIRAIVGDKDASDVAEIFKRMVPENIVQAAADGQMLGIIFFALLFGYFMTHLGHEVGETLFKFWDAVFHVMMKITEFIMMFAPIGVFGLVAQTISTAGFEGAKPLTIFAFSVVAALGIHAFIFMPLLLRFVGRVKPLAVLKGVSPAMLTAFSTASSTNPRWPSNW